MNIRFDTKLMETIVFQDIREAERTGNLALIAEYHTLVNPLYDLEDDRKREEGFAKAHRYFFERMGWHAWTRNLLAEFSLIRERVEEVLIRGEYTKKGEGAELYVEKSESRDVRKLVIQVRSVLFLSRSDSEAFFRHELMHIQDMCDPEFDYSPDLGMEETSPAEQNLIRERYRILWSLSVDGRLECRKKRPFRSREANLGEFARYFRFLTEEKCLELFESLWQDPKPVHAKLLALAKSPRKVLGLIEQESLTGPDWARPVPGSPCPLCAFPTFDWFDLSKGGDDLIRLVQQDFPDWALYKGLCGQCAEIYRSRGRT